MGRFEMDCVSLYQLGLVLTKKDFCPYSSKGERHPCFEGLHGGKEEEI